MSVARSRWLPEAAGYTAAVGGPIILTALLLPVGARQRDFVFLYIGLVAAIGVLRGLLPALLAAAVSFLLVDYFFVPPIHTLTIADELDLVNLTVFFATAVIVGGLASYRRRALVQAQQLARQLQELNAELTRLNREQAEAAQSAIRLARTEQQVQSLQQLDRDRRDLLANVSHDLRTPIGSILTDSTNMLRTQEMNASVRTRLESIAGEARRLNHLVSDMLDMARIDGGALQLTLEPVQLNDAIAAAAARLKKSSPSRDVHWRQEQASINVLADWSRLGQIFDNLLANADHAAPPATPIEVTVEGDDRGLVTVRVIDSGPGVPAEVKDHLFNRFVKGAANSGDGTGLGLAITRGLVEAHAGTIALEDRPEGGASFRFTLPRAES